MKIISDGKKFRKLIAHILFTTHCPCCGKLLNFGKNICDECRAKLLPLESPICHKCGKPVSDHDVDKCESRGYEVIGVYYYYDEVRSLILDFKSNKLSDAFEVFREPVIDKIAAEFSDVNFDMTVCVPSYEKNVYSSSRQMAKSVAKSFNIDFKDVLEKYRQTQKQHRLSQEERFRNLNNSIRVKANGYGQVKDKTVLVCDDVKSTGSTLFECTRALYEAGAKEVFCVCVAVSSYGKYKSKYD